MKQKARKPVLSKVEEQWSLLPKDFYIFHACLLLLHHCEGSSPKQSPRRFGGYFIGKDILLATT
jgi:hypothetical protein